ncbi:MAG: Zn-ribbon domain-containing OB-fold protein [Acidimicrobiales bacterium]
MGVLPDDWTLPALDPLNEAWFTSGKLLVQQCPDCGELTHPPEEICAACGSLKRTHRELSPTGTIHSYTVAHYAVNRALADAIPYAVILVSLDDAPQVRVIGNLLGAPPEAIEIGMRVVAEWEERVVDGETIRLPQWRLA